MYRWIFLVIIAVLCVEFSRSADELVKKGEKIRPFEFGFNIERQQHRHETQDEFGIRMGEFGFITADGIYHVTVFATDEHGKFKILAMKNYPYENHLNSVKMVITPSSTTQKPITVVTPKKPTPFPFGLKACSGCFLKATTQAPKLTTKSGFRLLSKPIDIDVRIAGDSPTTLKIIADTLPRVIQEITQATLSPEIYTSLDLGQENTKSPSDNTVKPGFMGPVKNKNKTNSPPASNIVLQLDSRFNGNNKILNSKTSSIFPPNTQFPNSTPRTQQTNILTKQTPSLSYTNNQKSHPFPISTTQFSSSTRKTLVTPDTLSGPKSHPKLQPYSINTQTTQTTASTPLPNFGQNNPNNGYTSPLSTTQFPISTQRTHTNALSRGSPIDYSSSTPNFALYSPEQSTTPIASNTHKTQPTVTPVVVVSYKSNPTHKNYPSSTTELPSSTYTTQTFEILDKNSSSKSNPTLNIDLYNTQKGNILPFSNTQLFPSSTQRTTPSFSNTQLFPSSTQRTPPPPPITTKTTTTLFTPVVGSDGFKPIPAESFELNNPHKKVNNPPLRTTQLFSSNIQQKLQTTAFPSVNSGFKPSAFSDNLSDNGSGSKNNNNNNNNQPTTVPTQSTKASSLPLATTQSIPTMRAAGTGSPLGMRTTNFPQLPTASPTLTKSAANNQNGFGVNAGNRPVVGGTSSGSVADGDLYRFKYILDYNGHSERGSTNGHKEGSYFAIDNDNVQRTIEYIANENGYQPHIVFKKIDATAARPKENTLKEYEFVWFNHP